MRKKVFALIVAAGFAMVLAFYVLNPSEAATPTAIQYKAVSLVAPTTEKLQEVLDAYGEQGWELILYDSDFGNLIFRK